MPAKVNQKGRPVFLELLGAGLGVEMPRTTGFVVIPQFIIPRAERIAADVRAIAHFKVEFDPAVEYRVIEGPFARAAESGAASVSDVLDHRPVGVKALMVPRQVAYRGHDRL